MKTNSRLESAVGSVVCFAVPVASTFRPAARWLAALLTLTALLGAAAAEPSFAEWRSACAKLPTNRSLGGRLPPKELLPLPGFDELGRLLDRFFAAATNGPLAQATHWHGTAPRPDTFLNVSRSWFAPPATVFEPFAEKLVLPPHAKVFLQGDLHGDLHSLLAVLGRLNERGLLDGFTVRDPDLQVIFLGDYTDRGAYGIEVIYTLLRLKLANPGRVHLVRGNHEDLSLVSRYGFLAEGRGKYGRSFDAAKILRAYDFLPVVFYLGSGTDFVQLCHGGVEPGFQPAPLLEAAGTNRFQLLGVLRQAEYLRQHPDWLTAEPRSAAAAKAEFRDFTPLAPTQPVTLGFMWNDFTVFRDDPAFTPDPDRAFVFGQPAVAYLLRQAGNAKVQVHAVIRAHQHSGVPNPLMRRLVASRGAFRHWQETNTAAAQTAPATALAKRVEVTASRALPEGSVWTLNVTPDSVYGHGNGYTFATFTVLQLGNTFTDWRLNVETVEVAGLQ